MPINPGNALARDALHVGVGFTVLAVQRAQVARRRLESVLPAPAAAALGTSIDTATSIAVSAAKGIGRALRR
jgi:hypothetical protein